MKHFSHFAHKDPDIMSGVPVFLGTRIPVHHLFEYLEAGDSIDVFLSEFPSVKHAQAVGVLEASYELATDALTA
jgi:uncharacterized protein (DUF433 family)